MRSFVKRLFVLVLCITLINMPNITVNAATEDTAIIIHATGSTKVSYKSCNRGYPGTNNRTIKGSNYSYGYGENGLASPQVDTTGTYTIPADGTYQFELKGGGGAAAFLDCAGGRCAFGGAGGMLIINVPLKAGDVITYSAAAGGIQASYGHSPAYDGRNADVAIGANGRNTTLKVNGTTVAIAYGGHGAYRFCQQGEDWSWCESVLKSEGNFNGAWKTHYPSDDPAIGGLGGGTWVASGRGIQVVQSTAGAGGQATVLSGLSNHVGQSGLLKQSWYTAASGYSKDQIPGYFLMSLNHTHTWEACDSACTEAGTKNRICTVCRGVAFGTITVPAHGHNFQPVTIGDPNYKCITGQEYFLSSSNSSSNKATSRWDGRPNYYWTKECQYCKGLAEPIYAYKVRYNEGNGQTILDPEWKYQNRSYNPMTQLETGWSRTGYYIAYWEYRGNQKRFTSGDPDWKPGTSNVLAQYSNLPSHGEEIVELWAVWKPIPYTLRIHENYEESGKQYKDYTLYYDSNFILPSALWQHDSRMYGYDFNKTIKITPQYKVNDTLRNLTTERNAIINIYTIWDLKPKVSLTANEIHYSALKASSSALDVDNGTVTRSDLEAALMAYASAEDYEWNCRYPGKIQPGTHNGYTFGIASFEPAKVKDNANGGEGTDTYYVTFQCTDDAGQSATATLTLFVGNINVDILVR